MSFEKVKAYLSPFGLSDRCIDLKESSATVALAAEALGTEPSRTLVVEDSLYALQTAGNAGFLTAGIYDALGEPDQEQMKKDAYIYCRDLTELQNHIFTENGGN